MSNKQKTPILEYLISGSVAILFVGGIIFLFYLMVPQPISDKTVIGGDRDSVHGCLGPAGYSYNDTVGACIRQWELNETQREAAKLAVERFALNGHSPYGVTILNVSYKPEEGDTWWQVLIDDNGNQTFYLIKRI
jgi:hypothetical protein